MRLKTYHDQAETSVLASPAEVFAHLDDQTRLAAHMEKRSMMMLGGRMTYDLDQGQGRAVGSVIRMRGSFLGFSLLVEEVVTERTPPSRKTWETRGAQRLLIIDSYVMGFETRAVGERTAVRIFIDYRLPSPLFWRGLGLLLAPLYARWCVSRMVNDLRQNFRPAAKERVNA
jgi:hypothetical protein